MKIFSILHLFHVEFLDLIVDSKFFYVLCFSELDSLNSVSMRHLQNALNVSLIKLLFSNSDFYMRKWKNVFEKPKSLIPLILERNVKSKKSDISKYMKIANSNNIGLYFSW